MRTLITVAIVAAIIAALVFLSSCASDGTFAGGEKPVDRAVTLRATCDAIKTADVAFHAFVAAKPDLVDANGIAVEKAIMQTVTPICADDFNGDLDGALKVAVTALVQITTVMQNWQQ